MPILAMHDLKSSLVVFLVALPLCLGISLASGAPLASGIISGIVGGVVIGFLSGSHISVSGPAAGLTVIVLEGIRQVGGFQNFTLVIVFAGILQIFFGLMKVGTLGEYFPTAVIKGMLAAIGLILIYKQLPMTLGLADFSNGITNFNGGVFIVSFFSLVIMFAWDKFASRGIAFFQTVPAALAAVLFAVFANETFHLVDSQFLVSIPKNIVSGFVLPNYSSITDFNVLQLAFTIAIVASLESLLSIDAADRIDPFKRVTNKNRELFAQGFGNMVSGFLGGLPVTAVIVRTSANVSAGARSKYSAIYHGIWLFLCVLLLPKILNLIPLATLACVLLLVGYKLNKPLYYKEMWRRGPDQLFIFLITIGSILTTDLLKGILAGLFVALLFELKKPSFKCVQVQREGYKIHFMFTNNVSFLHKPFIARLLKDAGEASEIHIHGLQLVRVHVDVHELIRDYQLEAKSRNMEIIFVNKVATFKKKGTEMTKGETKSSLIDSALAKSARLLPNIRPLKSFLHLNMFPDLLSCKFWEALDATREAYNWNPFYSIETYKTLYSAGSISDVQLRQVLQKDGWLEGDFDKEIGRKGKFVSVSEKSYRPLHKIINKQLRTSLNELTEPILIRFLSAYFDQGISRSELPFAEKGMYESFKYLCTESLLPFYPVKKRIFRESWTDDSESVIDYILRYLLEDENLFDKYIEECLLSLKGWSGLVKTIEKYPHLLVRKRSVSLKELLAIRLILEFSWVTLLSSNFNVISEKEYALEITENPPGISSRDFEVLKIWQLAFERSYLEKIVPHYTQFRAKTISQRKQKYQALFCIDDRECFLRYALEKTDPDCETFGTPGHFGLDFNLKHGEAGDPIKHCPDPVTAKFTLIKKKSFTRRN